MSELVSKVGNLIDPEEFYRAEAEWDGKSNVFCPFPDRHKGGKDSLPSMKVFKDTGGAFCHGCGYKATSPVYFYADAKGIKPDAAARILYSEWVEPLVPADEYRDFADKLQSNEFVLGKLLKTRGLTAETAKRFRLGYDNRRLTIPIFNELGLCVNLRKYDLFKDGGPKILSYGEGFGSIRLFPLETLKSDTVFMVEGELDAIIGLQYGLPCMSASGGNTAWSSEKFIKQARKALKGKTVFVVPDNDSPGRKGAANAMAVLSGVAKSCHVLELPRLEAEGEDLTDWLLSRKGSAEELRTLAGKMVGAEPERAPTLGGDDAIELNSAEEALVERATLAWETLRRNGNFFKNTDGDLFYAQDKAGVMKVTKEPGPFMHCLTRISPLYNQATSVGRFVLEHIRTEASAVSEMSKTSSWSLYYKGNLYVHAGDDTLLKITESKCEHIKNAINDEKVLLSLPMQGMEIPAMPDKVPANGLQLLKEFFLDNLAMTEEDKYLFVAWLTGAFFRDYIRPKPIVRFLAKTACGKSTGSKLASLLMYGQEMLNISASTMAAYYEMSALYPLVIMDNLETRNMIPMLEDFLLTAATGGTKSKRLVASDTGMVQHQSNCLVLTNGIEPFNKHELIDRTMELGLDIERYGNKKFHETKVFGGLVASREKILASLLYLVHKYVLPRVRKGEVGRIMGEFGSHGKERFNEYLALMAVILDALWGYMPVKGYASARDLTAYWLDSQTKALNAQNEGTDEVLYFLDTYVERYSQMCLAGAQTVVEHTPRGTVVKFSTRDLLSDFRVVSKVLGMRCPWTNERQLGTRLIDSAEVLRRAGWTATEYVSSGRKRHKYTKEIKHDSGTRPSGK